jgi:hypothetical protein
VDYVYLVASLPRLELTGIPPFTSEEMLRSSDGVLRRGHWEDLRALVEGRLRDVRTSQARRLVAAETRLRNALASLRAQRAGTEYARAAGREDEPDVVAARAMAAEDPLERESLLDRFRWTRLEEAAAQPPFGVQAVFAYALQLGLVEKWAALSDEAGLAVATRVVDENLAGIGL